MLIIKPFSENNKFNYLIEQKYNWSHFVFDPIFHELNETFLCTQKTHFSQMLEEKIKVKVSPGSSQYPV